MKWSGILAIATGMASVLNAQEFGATTGAAAADAGVEAVVTAQEAAPPAPMPVVLARRQIEAWAKGKFAIGWDHEKDRLITIQSAGANFDPTDLGAFLLARESLYVQAELEAKAAIIEAFLTNASAENVFSVGNPIADQLDKQKREVDRRRNLYQSDMQRAQEEAEKLMEVMDSAMADELRGVTVGDRLNALLDAAIKKLDETYSTETIEADKREKIEDLKQRYQRANDTLASVQEKQAELETELQKLQGEVSRSVSSKAEFVAQMPLFGAVTLAQAESYDDLKGLYQMAIIVAWSPKLELDARNILLNQAPAEPRMGTKTFNDWLDSMDLSVSIGTRRHLASDGTINFIGISAAEYEADDMYSMDDARMKAETWAKQYAVLAFKGDVESYTQAERLRRDVRTADGNTTSEVFEGITRDIMNSVKNLSISGLSIVRTEETVHPASGKHMVVAVASVNSNLAIRSSEIMKNTYATLAEVNQAQSYRAGEIQGMRAAAAANKNNVAAQRAGYASGSGAVAAEQQARKEAAKPAAKTVAPAPAPAQKAAGQTQSGTFMSSGEVEDDF